MSDGKNTPIWKKEITFRRKPEAAASEGDAGSTPLWKKEVSFRKKSEAGAVETPVETTDPVSEVAVEDAASDREDLRRLRRVGKRLRHGDHVAVRLDEGDRGRALEHREERVVGLAAARRLKILESDTLVIRDVVGLAVSAVACSGPAAAP